MRKQAKWRGIPTTIKHIDETKPTTITNRFGQLSVHLPRIDGQKVWAGFPGITGISRKIIPHITKSKTYVEPFAGTAKVYQQLIKEKKIEPGTTVLNDKASFIIKWLQEHFPNEIITSVDFIDCMQYWDSIDTFFMIDLPWFKNSYDQKFAYFDRKNVQQYDNEVIACCKKLTANFIISSRRENKRMLRSGFNNYLLQSEYIVCGKLPEVLLTTNMKLEDLKIAKDL